MDIEKKKEIQKFIKRLEDISFYEGIRFGRAYKLFNAEEIHADKCMQYNGYLHLSDAFKCYFLETIENYNLMILKDNCPLLSDNYLIFIPHITNDFRILCGSERIAIKGYPFQACTLLRNAFDNLVLLSAALQNITDFASIEGVKAGTKYDFKESKIHRKDTEFEVRKQMTGFNSGLSQETLSELTKIDIAFDLEVHGGHLSLTQSNNWMKQSGPLKVLPDFSETPFGMFINRYYEVAWMLHRLLPSIQLEKYLFGEPWNRKWVIIDESFKISEEEITAKLNKNFGAAIVEFIDKKFPFNQNSFFSQ
jgi:hypothetical protein